MQATLKMFVVNIRGRIKENMYNWVIINGSFLTRLN